MWAEEWQQVQERTGVRKEELGFQAQEPELCPWVERGCPWRCWGSRRMRSVRFGFTQEL